MKAPTKVEEKFPESHHESLSAHITSRLIFHDGCVLMSARTLFVATAGHGSTDEEGQPPRRKANPSLE